MADGSRPEKSYREVTISALVFALVIGVIMNAAITYAGLKIGFTIGGSAIAAVLGFGILRGGMRIFKKDAGSILETNIAQTAASAINTSNSGIIFTVPVLLLIGITLTWRELDFWLITLACIGGAMLGTAFIIPLRKQMIDIERLRFPTGTGVAVILKSPGAGAAKSLVLVAGIVVAALIYLPVALPQLTKTAELDQLDHLFQTERIGWQTVERTREIASWMDSERVPQDVLTRGRVLNDLDEARTRLGGAPEDKVLREHVAQIKKSLDDYPISGLYSDSLARAAYLASIGTVPWDSLRSKEYGWAADPMPGYADLQVRLPATPEAGAEARDLNGDGAKDTVLAESVDHDGNGRADLLVTDDGVNVGRILHLPDQFALVFAIAPFALGAGFITGRAGLLVLAGGVLAYFVLTPIAYMLGWMPQMVTAAEAPDFGHDVFNRPLGIGLLLGGAMMGIIMSLPAIKEALKSIAGAGRAKGGRDELGLKPLIVAVIGALVLLFVADDIVGNKALNANCPITGQQVARFEAGDPAAQIERPKREFGGYNILLTDTDAAGQWDDWTKDKKMEFLHSLNAKPGWLAGLPSHLRSAAVALIGALWIWLAGIIIAQCTGMTDWSPISGMALLTVVLVMLLAGTGAVIGAVLIGAALCVAITLAADMMQDLRTGHLVGAKPLRQQVVELSVVGIGPLVSMLVVLIIAAANQKSFGVAMGPGTPTVAPQAQALQAVITGVQGGEMPYALYGFGALLGALLGLGAFSGLGVLVGLSMYLPFEYIATYGIGCVVHMALSKAKGARWCEEWGVPFAAGLIVGESCLALIINLIVLARG